MKAKDYAADVPLICDPVPGPAFITVDRALSLAEVEQLRRAILEGHVGPNRARAISIQIAPTGYRTEWPDAEFCAA